MLTNEQIVAHWNKYQSPLMLGRFVEAEARRDALEEAAKLFDGEGEEAYSYHAAERIRALKETIQ
ncbi:hypothetical protein C8C99_0265 [Acidovorax sp. 107]|uniref:hypothetical protein n=1 Tax=Acidovorax sp. 107 TaxID=2135638 RepID=UPI000D370FE3|nr:hypothetical protein [Acidovorax sp. 107]PUA95465.1 hypothetical protein C8C99_0265 [Acidovorax sp. 107]